MSMDIILQIVLTVALGVLGSIIVILVLKPTYDVVIERRQEIGQFQKDLEAHTHLAKKLHYIGTEQEARDIKNEAEELKTKLDRYRVDHDKDGFMDKDIAGHLNYLVGTYLRQIIDLRPDDASFNNMVQQSATHAQELAKLLVKKKAAITWRSVWCGKWKF